MPRSLCPRCIEGRPEARYTKPAGIPLRVLEEIWLATDERESLRLADLEQLYRADAAVHMKIPRRTFDRILRRARTKVAEALLNGRALRLEQPI